MKNPSFTVEQLWHNEFDDAFQSLLVSFRIIAGTRNAVRREFLAAKLAVYHQLPRSEFRRIYRLWCVEVGDRHADDIGAIGPP